MSNPLLVGVDIHRQTNTVCLMDAAGHVLGSRRTIDNNRPGAKVLVNQLAIPDRRRSHRLVLVALLPNPLA